MNVIEAAKSAGWPQTAIDMASKQEIERLERFAQVIRNQALEEAETVAEWTPCLTTEPQEIAAAIRALKDKK